MKHPLRFLSFAAAMSAALSPFAANAQQSKAGSPRIFRYRADDKPKATWSIAPKPLLSMGGAAGEGPKEFGQVLGIVRVADGRIVVADGPSSELRVFSPSGEFIRNIGRNGKGPGEFNGIQYLLRSADTIVVHDRTTRLQMFTADGTVLRSYERPPFPGHGVSSWPGILNDGSGVVVGVDPTPEFTTGEVSQTATLGLRGPKETEAHGFTQVPVFQRVKHDGQSVGLFLGAVARYGVMGPRVCFGYSQAWQVTCFDRTGKLISRTTREVDPGPVTKADIEEFKKAYVDANKARNGEAASREAVEKLQYAEKRSAFGRFVPASTGELWVGEFVVLESFIPGKRGTATPPRPSKWSILDNDGSWVADVVLPAHFSLLDAGKDYVAGVETDADDTETVVVYKLCRAARCQ